MKVKSSLVLQGALARILDGRCNYACAAIQDCETDLRYENNGENIVSKATQIFNTFKPKSVPELNKGIQEWWPKGSEERVVALKLAIDVAVAKGD